MRKLILYFLCFFLLKTVQAQSPFNLLPDTIGICQGDSVLLKFPKEKISENANYEWFLPGKIITNTKQMYIKTQGKCSVKILDGNVTVSDTTYLKVYPRPKVHIRDTVICWGGGVRINASAINSQYKYNWSTGEVGNSINVERGGKYWVKVNNKGCAYTDTFKVWVANEVIPNFKKEMIFCDNEENKTLSVSVNQPEVKLYWNTGAQGTSINAVKEGQYWVRSTSKTCGRHVDSVMVKFKSCDCEIYVPSSFTPNDDDKNDYFYPMCQCDYQYFFMTIYDRWGNLVYSTSNINAKWDGRFKGNLCPDDVYVYKIEAIQKNSDKKVVKSGHISLFR